MKTFILGISLLLALPSFANDQFACEAVYQTKAKRNAKTIDRLVDHSVWKATPIVMLTAAVINSTPLFFIPLAAGGVAIGVVNYKESQINNYELLQYAIAEAQLGKPEFTRHEMEAILGELTTGYRYNRYSSNFSAATGLEQLLKKLNQNRRVEDELTYDEVAQKLRELAPTTAFCPKGRPISFRKIKKLLSE